MKKFLYTVLVVMLVVIFSRYGALGLMKAVAYAGGFDAAASLLPDVTIKKYEGGLRVGTGHLLTGQHIQSAERNGKITVGCPYIDEGY